MRTIEEWIASAQANITTEIAYLEDRLRALRELRKRVPEITGYVQLEQAFNDTGATGYYNPGDFPNLREFAEHYDQIKAGEY